MNWLPSVVFAMASRSKENYSVDRPETFFCFAQSTFVIAKQLGNSSYLQLFISSCLLLLLSNIFIYNVVCLGPQIAKANRGGGSYTQSVVTILD